MLWISQLSFTWIDSEKCSVEFVNVFKRSARFYVARVAKYLFTHSLGGKLRVGQRRYRFNAVAQVSPVLLNVASARKASRHANNGNVTRPSAGCGDVCHLISLFSVGLFIGFRLVPDRDIF